MAKYSPIGMAVKLRGIVVGFQIFARAPNSQIRRIQLKLDMTLGLGEMFEG